MGALLRNARDKPSIYVALPVLMLAAVFMAFDAKVFAAGLMAVGILIAVVDLIGAHGLRDQTWWLAGTAIFMTGLIIVVGTGWQGGWWITAFGMLLPQGRNAMKRKR